MMHRSGKKTAANRKTRMKTNPEPKTVGTRIAEKARAKANGYSDVKRQQLLDRGLAMIYGNSGYAKVNRGGR
jgi:hypothetical protein